MDARGTRSMASSTRRSGSTFFRVSPALLGLCLGLLWPQLLAAQLQLAGMIAPPAAAVPTAVAAVPMAVATVPMAVATVPTAVATVPTAVATVPTAVATSLTASRTPAAEVATRNFIIRAPNPQLAQQAARLAEQYRRDLAIQWLGQELPPWNEKCPVQVIVDRFPGGETSFAFVSANNGEKSQPIGWQMKVFGPPDRVLDAVLPHEITHTIFATHFGRPLPRWADEGACTTVEHESERAKNHRMLIDFLTGKPSRGIPFNRMFTMTEYPHDILPLYAQGYSLAKFLIRQKDHRTFVAYIGEGLQRSDSRDSLAAWNEVTQKYYGYKDLSDLQLKWLKWVENGSPLDIAASAGPAPIGPTAEPAATEKFSPPVVAALDAATINGSWVNASLPNPGPGAQALNGTLAGTVQGSWYRQQMSAGMQNQTPSDAASAQADSFQPGSIRSANPEVLLR